MGAAQPRSRRALRHELGAGVSLAVLKTRGRAGRQTARTLPGDRMKAVTDLAAKLEFGEDGAALPRSAPCARG